MDIDNVWAGLCSYMDKKAHGAGVQISGVGNTRLGPLKFFPTAPSRFNTPLECDEFVVARVASGDEYYIKLWQWLVKARLGIYEEIR